MATRFRNITGEDLSVNAPPGHPDSHLVEAGEVLRVPGLAVEYADHYLTGEGDAARAYPKALWHTADAVPAPEDDPADDLGEDQDDSTPVESDTTEEGE